MYLFGVNFTVFHDIFVVPVSLFKVISQTYIFFYDSSGVYLSSTYKMLLICLEAAAAAAAGR